MGQMGFWKNISGTVCAIGIALSTVNANSTLVVNGNYQIPYTTNYNNYNESCSTSYDIGRSNIYCKQEVTTKLEDEAISLFGKMRDATPEEQESVNNYIKSISKDTGVEFFNLC